MSAATSYASQTHGLRARLSELSTLVKAARERPGNRAEWVLETWNDTRARVLEHAGVTLEGKRGLDIGPGQGLGCLRCFSVHNQMLAIDTDVIVQEGSLGEYARMLAHNGAMRTLKTLGRRALGIDAALTRTLARAMNVPAFPTLPVLRMSATAMDFADASFDFVYSHSVFEHIDAPAQALEETARVLAPGGVAYVSLHLYTCHSGQHDPRILTAPRPQPPFWPHLRPRFQASIRPNAWLNQLRLEHWQTLFRRAMPGVTLLYDRQDDALGGELRRLRKLGELSGYSDDELLTVNVIGIWKKPRLRLVGAVAFAKVAAPPAAQAH